MPFQVMETTGWSHRDDAAQPVELTDRINKKD
jgi:hypothetical protein